MDIAFAGELYRLIFQRDTERWEQRYTQAGGVSGPVRKLEVAVGPPDQRSNWISLLVMGALSLMLIVGIRRKRGAEGGAELPATFVLAPYPHRVAAALD